MPGQRRTFDPQRVLPDAFEDGQLAELDIGGRRGGSVRAARGRIAIACRLARHSLVDPPEQRARFFDRSAFERFGHQRGRRGRDRAAGAVEADVLYMIAVDLEVDGDFVAAQRVIALGFVCALVEFAEVLRLTTVVEDRGLVELAQFGHVDSASAPYPSMTSRTRCSASTRRSMSSRLL